MTPNLTAQPMPVSDALLRTAIVRLPPPTAYIHSTLGGLLFTLNALGYLAAAVAMVAPFQLFSRFRWIVRLGLMAYAALTILAWAVGGASYSTAYLAKGIEVALIALLALEFRRARGRRLARARGLSLTRIAILAVAAVTAALTASCAAGSDRPGPSQSIDLNAPAISARGLAFSTGTLSAPAGRPFQLVFDNQSAVPHNVAIYEDASATRKLFGEEPFGGPRVVVYNVPALSPGSYLFRCDLHPDMKGTRIAG